MPSTLENTNRTIVAAVLAWLLPGAGHYWLGHRGLGIAFFCAISLAYWTGAAVGGVKNSINPKVNGWLFLAEMGVGGYTAAGFAAGQAIGEVPPERITEYVSYYPSSDVAQAYLSVAGLLNVIAILDALARAQSAGAPLLGQPPPSASGEPAT